MIEKENNNDTFVGIINLSPQYTVEVSIPLEKNLYDYSYQEVEQALNKIKENKYPYEYYPKSCLTSIYLNSGDKDRKLVVKESLTASWDKDTTIELPDSELVDKNDKQYKLYKVLTKYNMCDKVPYHIWINDKTSCYLYHDIKNIFDDINRWCEMRNILKTTPDNNTNITNETYNPAHLFVDYSNSKDISDIFKTIKKCFDETFNQNARKTK